MNLPEVTIQQLLESGVHFGHHKKRWNPKMEKYIFGVRNNIHIIDLRLTLPLLYKACSSPEVNLSHPGNPIRHHFEGRFRRRFVSKVPESIEPPGRFGYIFDRMILGIHLLLIQSVSRVFSESQCQVLCLEGRQIDFVQPTAFNQHLNVFHPLQHGTEEGFR